MPRVPIKKPPSSRTPDKLPPKPNAEAVTETFATKARQLHNHDSGDVPRGTHPGAEEGSKPTTMAKANAHANDELRPNAGYGSSRLSPDLTTQRPGGLIAGPGSGYTDVTPVAEGAGEVVENAADFVDTLDPDERHEKRMAWFYSEAARQSENRRQMAKDEAFYDNEQWDYADAAVLEERGQKPIVYNEVAPTIDWLIGTERRSRVDFYVVAQDSDDAAQEGRPGYTSPSDDAINKTKLLKYLDDVNMAPFERSAAADDAFKAGLGILEVGLRGDKTGVPIFVGAESWRNCLHDSRAKKDQSDARYFFRTKELDLDVAIALFPEHEAYLRAAATDGDGTNAFRGLYGISGHITGLGSFGDGDFALTDTRDGVSNVIDIFNARDRVTIIECWSREPMRRKPRADSGMGDPITFKVRVSLMIEDKTLLEAWSPFKHDRIPFVLVWAYRNKRTGMPYGPIRRLRGPQEGLNRRMARGLFESSFNQVWMEKGAIDKETMTVEELQAEMNDPTGVALFANGALSGNRVRQRDNPGQAREQIMLAEGDRQALRAMSGVNDENRGLQSAATSRVAMDAKAERGSIATSELFDNQLLARQVEGEITLSLCEQFVKQPMTIRVAGEGGPGSFERTKINQPSHYESGKPVYLNDITKMRAHFVVGEQAYKQSYAESAFASLMDVLTQLASAAPQVVIGLLDVVFDMHPNLPRKKVVIARIRAINGQTDPDGKLTPEQAAAAKQKADIAQQQFELQMATLKAEVMAVQAKGEKLSTDAMVARITALYEAAQTAQVLALAPSIAPIADKLAAAAGFVPMNAGPAIPQPPQGAPVDAQGQAATTTQGRMMALQNQPGGMPDAPPAGQSAGTGAQAGIETARPDGMRGMSQPPEGAPA